MIIKRKLYTKYDDTDRLKQMKDSDILAEKKKKKPGYGKVVSAAVGGTLAGGLAAGMVGGIRGAIKPGHTMLRGAGKWGKIGAIGAGTLAGLIALREREKEEKDNSFYNKRLEYAQRQAERREKKDWKSNMTQREGYTY